jgi:hypothetical protein
MKSSFFFLFLIIIFDIFMYPLRHREKEGGREAKSIFLLLSCLFVNLVRSSFFLYRARTTITTAIPTPSLSLSLITTHLLLSLNRSGDIYVYIHDIIVRIFFFNSFGKRTPNNQYRINECVVLEPSEMLVVSRHDI